MDISNGHGAYNVLVPLSYQSIWRRGKQLYKNGHQSDCWNGGNSFVSIHR